MKAVDERDSLSDDRTWLRSNRYGEERSGLLFALTTALISGAAIFVDSYGVKDFSNPTAYTTAKNLVAALLLCLLAAIIRWKGRKEINHAPAASRSDKGAKTLFDHVRVLLGYAYVGIVGGGLAFIAFFDGLARTQPLQAGFEHDTLVIWVALLAFVFLGERLSWWNLAAMALLVAGAVVAGGGLGRLVPGEGGLLVLAATLAWSIEVVVSKQLLKWTLPTTLGLVRMGVGVVVLVSYLAFDGYLRLIFDIDEAQLAWVVLTGMLLAGYVFTWLTALKRSRAVDVTSVLVASVILTAVLSALTGHTIYAPRIGGLILVALGAGMVLWFRVRHREHEADRQIA